MNTFCIIILRATRMAALLLALLLALTGTTAAQEARIRMASTTSTQNSGLLDYLIPIFQTTTGIRVDVVAVGTGAALKIGQRGDSDLVLVHAKQLELELLKERYFVNRRDVMYNDFVIIGPPGDPAGIAATKSASEAFTAIFNASAPFVSRGDLSGTHMREMSVWKAAGLKPKGRPWYMQVGQGMARSQRIANEKRAYTLTDRGTWLAKIDTLELKILFEGDPALRNQYGVMAVNPARHEHVKFEEAMKFINWLTSYDGQEAIASFTDANGNRLFIPNAQ